MLSAVGSDLLPCKGKKPSWDLLLPTEKQVFGCLDRCSAVCRWSVIWRVSALRFFTFLQFREGNTEHWERYIFLFVVYWTHQIRKIRPCMYGGDTMHEEPVLWHFITVTDTRVCPCVRHKIHVLPPFQNNWCLIFLSLTLTTRFIQKISELLFIFAVIWFNISYILSIYLNFSIFL